MTDDRNSSSIAIIGMAGRFPEAPTLDAFWNNLAAGKESLAEFSDEEILSCGVDPALLNHPNYVRKGTVLEDAEFFDASFFGFNPREAQIIDPQQRVFLECAWHALEDAGYAGDDTQRGIGLYAGASINSYLFSNLLRNREVLEAVGSYQLMLASDKDFLATRVAYKLDLHGPAMTIQTACSTSLVAVQVACQSLLGGQCDLALAGGVSITYPSRSGYLYTDGMIFSPDGHCRPFDAQGAGIRGGAGAGVVVLKRLADAVRDRDSIRAVIRGAAVNNDGSAKIGYTAPSIEGQAQVIRAAQAMAGCEPDTISYIEAHGTATALGDPIEISALERVFRARTARKSFCAVGSVKSNIGHLDAAAGVAGLIKTVLALQHRQIPASLHYRQPNARINFAESPFFVNDRLRPWPRESGPRRAGVSSFGIGGTNAHLVLEEAAAPQASRALRSLQVLPLSAKTPDALRNSFARLERHLLDQPDVSLADTAYTLQVGRRRLPYRHAVVCESREDAMAAIAAASRTLADPAAQEAFARPVAYLLSGQGSQHVRMAEQVYRDEPVFRRSLDSCAELLLPLLGCDLREAIYPSGGQSLEAATNRLHETWLTQPALFAIEYSLAQMWMAWGIAPAACLGHSIGEYVAACLAGVFSLSDALRLVTVRGRLMHALPRGSMLAVALPFEQVSKLLNYELCIAAVNTFTSCTVSGPDSDVARLERELAASGVHCARVATSHAFHSAMMEPVLDPFIEVVRSVRLSPPEIPFVSNLTGTWIRPEEATSPTYWALHLRNTVRFADGLRQLLDASNPVLLEVGPGQVLANFAREVAGKSRQSDILPSLPHRNDPQSSHRHVLQTLGRLWTCGAAVDWQSFHAGEALNRVPLPTYPFDRKRYCVEPKPAEMQPPDSANEGGGRKNPDISDWFYLPAWQRSERLSLPQDARTLNEGPWLVFMDRCGLGAAIRESLLQNGVECIPVHAGEQFEKRRDRSYVISPGNRDHYSLLLAELSRAGSVPRSVAHLWNVTHAGGNRSDPHDRRDLAFYSLVYMAQAWTELHENRPLSMVVAADELHSVCSDEEPVAPEKALLTGPCKVIPQEHPEIACACIDVGLQNDLGAVVASLLQETEGSGFRGVVAYRGGWRWEQTCTPKRLGPVNRLPVRSRGVYLITGGLGGIGLTLADYFARTAQARLVLIARSPLPARSEWDAWLSAHDGNESTSDRIRRIRALEEAGAEVLVMAADVTSSEQMSGVFAEARRRFGGIDGVIHAAGVAGGGLVALKHPPAANAVLAPKVDGTLILDELLRGEPHADCLILCSSVTALQGGIGAVDYCSANAFLDAFAESRAYSSGCRVISINWDAWQEVGMAVKAALPRDLAAAREKALNLAITPAEGVEAFQRVLSADFSQVGVITRDLRHLIQQARTRNGASAKPATATTDPASPPLETLTTGNGDSSESATELAIRHIWSELLGIEDVKPDDNFFTLGGHSLLATGILSRIRSHFGVHLPVRAIFDSPTVKELAFVVEARLWRERTDNAVKPGNEDEREVIEL